MVKFSAAFPIAESANVGRILGMACDWVLGSPHTNLSSEKVSSLIFSDGEGYVEDDFEKIYAANVSTKDIEMGGFRYVKIEEGIEWVTTIVATQTPSETLVSVQVGCEALDARKDLPRPKKPYIIKQILSEIGGGSDGRFLVCDKPVFLEKGQEDFAADIILGSLENNLPVVYVSAGFDGKPTVKSEKLAQRLSGSAHVVVEPNAEFSVVVRGKVGGRNPYDGTVRVYWPGSNYAKSYFKKPGEDGYGRVELEIARDVVDVLSNRRIKTYCTWLHLMECVSQERIKKLKDSGSGEIKEYVDAFDAELKAKQEKLDECEREVSRLQMEVYNLEQQLEDNNIEDSLILKKSESDFYPGEIKSIVMDVLGKVVGDTVDGSRRRHILSDLLDLNQCDAELGNRREKIKNIFRNYREMTAKINAELASLGFERSEVGKHHKLVYCGDGRYAFTISKTSSDVRAGMDFASDVNKIIS